MTAGFAELPGQPRRVRGRGRFDRQCPRVVRLRRLRFLRVTMAKLFFPTGDETVSLLLAFATFGVTFFMRPLGAIVLGGYADRHGRKAAFTLAIALMMIGTAMIAVTPTYATIGCWRRSSSCSPAWCKASRPAASSAAPPPSCRAEPGAPRLFRELAVREPGAHHHPCHRLRSDVDQRAHLRRDGGAGAGASRFCSGS